MAKLSTEEENALLWDGFGIEIPGEGTVVKGRVVAIEAGQAVIDVGNKMASRIDLKDLRNPGEERNISVGDVVEVNLGQFKNASGEAVTSQDRASREEAWDRLEKAFTNNQRIEGVIFSRVKGGFAVDLDGAVAFLPGSQTDVRPVRDARPLMGVTQPFLILKLDRNQSFIVVSRRAILEDTRDLDRAETTSKLAEGQVVDGVVKNITEFGAFIDLGGVDGLLHFTDMAWSRVNHPSEVLSIGETIRVMVIKINRETHRISLGIKQLQPDPWDKVEKAYPLGSVHNGRVIDITEYGAFVELEAGVEGLIHVSEMSWIKENVHPRKILSTSQVVEVIVLGFDGLRRRVNLGLKQTQHDSTKLFADSHRFGSTVDSRVQKIDELGLGLTESCISVSTEAEELKFAIERLNATIDRVNRNV